MFWLAPLMEMIRIVHALTPFCNNCWPRFLALYRDICKFMQKANYISLRLIRIMSLQTEHKKKAANAKLSAQRYCRYYSEAGPPAANQVISD